MAHFGPESLAHFEPDSVAHFGRNTQYVIDSVRFEKIKGPTITGNFRLMFFDKETYYDHIIHVNSEKEYEDFCKLLRSWKILKPSFIIDFGRG